MMNYTGERHIKHVGETPPSVGITCWRDGGVIVIDRRGGKWAHVVTTASLTRLGRVVNELLRSGRYDLFVTSGYPSSVSITPVVFERPAIAHVRLLGAGEE